MVEDIPIRSIRLRDLSGNVHAILFSSVGTVTNMTKDFSYYLMDIGVDYQEDTDRVVQVCTELLDDMRKESPFASTFSSPWTSWGSINSLSPPSSSRGRG